MKAFTDGDEAIREQMKRSPFAADIVTFHTMDDVPPPTGDAPSIYDPAVVVRTYATYQDPLRERRTRFRRRPARHGRHPYTSERNFRVHCALLDIHLPASGTVLEIGPGGAANYTNVLATRGRQVVAGDISPKQLSDLRSNLTRRAAALTRTLEMDVTSIPVADRSVDGVVCIGGVLSYVFDAAPLAVKEIRRVLIPGGRAIISVMSPGWISSPTMGYKQTLPDERYQELLTTRDVLGPGFDSADHTYRCYSSADLIRLLETGGFRVIDCLASHIDGVADNVSLDRYIEACHNERARDTTRGYLIAVVERPVADA